MAFKITPIGVNHAFTTAGFETNFLLEAGSKRLLIDCGATAARALAQLGIRLSEIEDVYISHLHLDHVAGLVQLGIERFFIGLPRPRVHLADALLLSLWENFLKGPLGFYRDADGREQETSIDTFFEFVPIKGTFRDSDHCAAIAGFSLKLVPVPHVPQMSCHGLIVEDRLLMTTDTTFAPDLLEEIANRFPLEAIIHDCSFISENWPIHCTYQQLQTLPKDLFDLLYLIHYEEWAPELAQPEVAKLLCRQGVGLEF